MGLSGQGLIFYNYSFMVAFCMYFVTILQTYLNVGNTKIKSNKSIIPSNTILLFLNILIICDKSEQANLT